MLFGNVTLGKERSNEELEEKLKDANKMIETLNEKLSTMNIEYKKLRKCHRGVLKRKSVHYFKKGSVERKMFHNSNSSNDGLQNRCKKCAKNKRLK